MLWIPTAMKMKLMTHDHTIIRLPRQIQSLLLVRTADFSYTEALTCPLEAPTLGSRGNGWWYSWCRGPSETKKLQGAKVLWLRPFNCWINSKLNVMGTFSHWETSSRTGYRVSPLRASLAKTMGVRTGQPPPQHHKPFFVEGIWFLREAKPSVASRRREKRQERAKLRHGLGVNSLVLWQSRDAEFVAFEFQESCFPSWSISQSLYTIS